MKEDPQYISKESVIDSLNKFLMDIGEAAVDVQRLSQKNYCKQKVATISNLLKKLIFCGNLSESDDESEDFGKTVLNSLKKKISSQNKSEKTSILTVVPQNWSVLKTMNEFEGIFHQCSFEIRFCVSPKDIYFVLLGASEHMIRAAKKLLAEKGILSSPNVKYCRRLPAETESLVKNFYTNDEHSRQMPGKNDFVSI